MAEVGPFDGLLYDPALAGPLEALTAPPYDVISPEQLPAFRDRSPYNITRVDLGEEPDDARPEAKYTRAGELLRRWRAEGVLIPTNEAAVYPYEMAFREGTRDRRVRGVILEATLEEWGAGVLPHERTMPGPIEDRLAQLRGTRANVSPIYALVGELGPAQRSLIKGAAGRPPDREVTDEEDGVTHRVWVERDGEALAAAYRGRPLLIADGHHRYQTALVYRDERRAADGPGPWDAVMMFVVEVAEDPPVLPAHRVVRADVLPDIEGEEMDDLLELLSHLDAGAMRFGAAIRAGNEPRYLLGDLLGEPPVVRALHQSLLDGNEAIREIRFVRDANEADEEVREGRADIAFFLPPARAEDIQRTTEAGERLPEKSTYFWPKPRTGMVIRPLE